MSYRTTGAAAWISPSGEVHPLAANEGHWLWVERNRDKVHQSLHDPSAEKMGFRMLEHGWIRQASPDAYHVGRGRDVNRVRDHVLMTYPRLQNVRVDHPAGTKDLSTHEAKVQWQDTFGGHSAAWISPQDEVHTSLGGSHYDWIADHWDSIASHHKTSRDDLAGTQNKMLAGGWIRKVTKDTYQIGHRSHLPRVVDHVLLQHPSVKKISIEHEHGGKYHDFQHDIIRENSNRGTHMTAPLDAVEALLNGASLVAVVEAATGNLLAEDHTSKNIQGWRTHTLPCGCAYEYHEKDFKLSHGKPLYAYTVKCEKHDDGKIIRESLGDDDFHAGQRVRRHDSSLHGTVTKVHRPTGDEEIGQQSAGKRPHHGLNVEWDYMRQPRRGGHWEHNTYEFSNYVRPLKPGEHEQGLNPLLAPRASSYRPNPNSPHFQKLATRCTNKLPLEKSGEWGRTHSMPDRCDAQIPAGVENCPSCGVHIDKLI